MRRETYFPQLAILVPQRQSCTRIRTRGSSKIPGYESKLRATPSSIAHAAPSDVSLPAVSSCGGLRTPAPVYVAPSSWAGIRKPSHERTHAAQQMAFLLDQLVGSAA